MADIERGWSWLIVVAVAFTAILYIVRGGLKAGVVTDALQSVSMIVAAFVLWGVVWVKAGGWKGLNEKLLGIDANLPETLLHVGGYSPAWSAAPVGRFRTYRCINDVCVD